jgi:hypothetical protein
MAASVFVIESELHLDIILFRCELHRGSILVAGPRVIKRANMIQASGQSVVFRLNKWTLVLATAWVWINRGCMTIPTSSSRSFLYIVSALRLNSKFILDGITSDGYNFLSHCRPRAQQSEILSHINELVSLCTNMNNRHVSHIHETLLSSGAQISELIKFTLAQDPSHIAFEGIDYNKLRECHDASKLLIIRHPDARKRRDLRMLVSVTYVEHTIDLLPSELIVYIDYIEKALEKQVIICGGFLELIYMRRKCRA